MSSAASTPQKRFARKVPPLNLERVGLKIGLNGNGKEAVGSISQGPGSPDSGTTLSSSSRSPLPSSSTSTVPSSSTKSSPLPSPPPKPKPLPLLTGTSRDTVEKLRAELRMKAKEINELNVEIKTLKTMIIAKDIALQESDVLCSAANERLLKARGEVSMLRKELTNVQNEKDKLQLEFRMATTDCELLNKTSKHEKDLLAEREKHLNLIKKLQNGLAEAQKEIQRLDLNSKAPSKVIAAKDMALDEAFKKNERTIEAMKDLESSKGNAIGELKRQLMEAQWRITFLERQQGKIKKPIKSLLQSKPAVKNPLQENKVRINGGSYPNSAVYCLALPQSTTTI